MRIEYKKKAVKYNNSCDKPTKQRLKEAIEKLPLGDVKKLSGLGTDYRLRVGVVKFIPEDKPEPDELEAIAEAKADTSPTVPHEAINWD